MNDESIQKFNKVVYLNNKIFKKQSKSLNLFLDFLVDKMADFVAENCDNKQDSKFKTKLDDLSDSVMEFLNDFSAPDSMKEELKTYAKNEISYLYVFFKKHDSLCIPFERLRLPFLVYVALYKRKSNASVIKLINKYNEWRSHEINRHEMKNNQYDEFFANFLNIDNTKEDTKRIIPLSLLAFSTKN